MCFNFNRYIDLLVDQDHSDKKADQKCINWINYLLALKRNNNLLMRGHKNVRLVRTLTTLPDPKRVCHSYFNTITDVSVTTKSATKFRISRNLLNQKFYESKS